MLHRVGSDPFAARPNLRAALAHAVGSGLVVFAGALVLAASLCFLAGVPLGRALAPGALAVAAVCVWRAARPLGGRARRWALLALLATVAGACLVERVFYDQSWDGQDYHQLAIGELSRGWNPIRAQRLPDSDYRNAWLNHYPKGAWASAASLFLVLRNMEAAKALNLVLIAGVFLLALGYFLREQRLRRWQALLLAVLIALNPVAVCQMFTNYVDGLTASALAAMLLAYAEALRRPRPLARLTLAAALVVALNLKFTGTVYSILIAAALALHALVGGQQPRRLLVAIGGGLLVGFFVVGYQPYVTNWARFGNPLYPVAAKGNRFEASFMVRGAAPPSFLARSRFSKLAVSLLARTANEPEPVEIAYKLPLAASGREWAQFEYCDVRLGGFGPLFGAAFLLAATILLLVARERPQASLLALWLLGTALVNPDPWWARYSPQLWLIPPIAIAAAWLGRSPGLRRAGTLLALLLLVDAAGVAGVSVAANLRNSNRTRYMLGHLQWRNKEVRVFVGPLDGVLRLLDQRGIRYRRVQRREEIGCPTPITRFTAWEGCQR